MTIKQMPRRLLAIAVLSLGLLVPGGTGHARATASGTVVAWGCIGQYADFGQCNVPSGLSGVTAIAAGPGNGLALKSDGTVVAWGCNGTGAGPCAVPSGLSGVTAIATDGGHSLALKSDGTVVAWGCPSINLAPCSVPSGLTGVTAISTGLEHSLAVKSDGTVVAWGCGFDDFGQCTVPSGLTGVVAVAAGETQSIALRRDGTVVAWGGCRFYSQCPPNDYPGVSAISAGYAHTLGVKTDGTVVAWGCTNFDHGQCNVGGITGATDVAAGTHHSLILKRDGTVVAVGCGIFHGFGDFGQCTVPAGLSRVSAVAASTTYSLALIGPRKQTITFAPLPNKTFGDPDFTVSATASSGLPVSFAASGHCTLRRAKVHLTGPGSCTISASQAGNANWRPAPPVPQTFSIAPAPCRVPKVTGKRLPAAKAAIARRHCRTGKVGYASSRKRKGVVLSQSRKPGLVLAPNAKIDLVVSRGRKR
jgi:alpha-tubulin suppressor-like RCC1 family protein